MAKRKRATKPTATSPEKYIGATVTIGDRAQTKWKPTDAQALAKRVQQFALWCMMFNATNCAGHKMKLIRQKGARGSAKWAGRPLSRKQRDYLAVPVGTKGYGPGLKAASFAQDANGDIEEVADHPALDLLNNANPWQRGTTFAKACWFQGEAYGARYINVVQKPSQEPEELWVMYTNWVRPIPDEHDLVSGWMYGRDRSVEQEFMPQEVLPQIMFPNPFNPYTGLSPLHTVFADADIYTASQDSELSMWKNGARPDFAVKVPSTATDKQIDQMRGAFEQRHRGPTRRGDFFIMRDAEVTPLAFTQREMQYLEGRQDVRSVIGAAYGIPETFWRMTNQNLAGAEAAKEFYDRYAVAPRLAQDAEEWTEGLLPLFGIEGGEYWFVYDDPCPANQKDTRDDIVAFVPIGVWSKKFATELTGGRSPEDDGEEDPQAREERVQAEQAQMAADNKPQNDKPKPAGQEQKDADVAVEVKAALNDVSAGGTNPPDAFVKQMYANVDAWLDMVAREVGIPGKPDEFSVEDLNRFVPALLKGTNPPTLAILEDAGAVGAAEVAAPSPVNIPAFNDDAAEYMKTNDLRLAGSVTQTQTDRIKEIMAQGLENGASQAEMARDVRTVLQGERVARATTIVRTECARAHQVGKQMGWKAAGYWGSRWILAPGACPVCVEFVKKYGDTSALDDTFAVKGSTLEVNGKIITLDYSDVDSPPLHVNCRCYVSPVKVEPQ